MFRDLAMKAFKTSGMCDTRLYVGKCNLRTSLRDILPDLSYDPRGTSSTSGEEILEVLVQRVISRFLV